MFIASYRKSNDVEFLFLVLLLSDAVVVPVVIMLWKYETMTCSLPVSIIIRLKLYLCF